MAVTFRYSETVRKAKSLFVGYLVAAYQWAEIEFEGLVLEVGSESHRIMSDVWGTRCYAVVWDSENECPKNITLDIIDSQLGWYNNPVSREWSNWKHSAEIDATPEIKEKYQSYLNAEAEAKCLSDFNENIKRGEEKASEIDKGSYVEVFKGRKIPKGTTGKVFWIGSNRYGWRVGLKTESDETVWVAMNNVRVVPGHENWDTVCPDCGDSGWIPAYDGKGGTVACPECEVRNQEAYEAQKAREAEEVRRFEERQIIGITRGATVEVIGKGHKNDAPVGVVGKVFWIGQSKFGDGERVGLKSSGETYWAAVENVQAA